MRNATISVEDFLGILRRHLAHHQALREGSRWAACQRCLESLKVVE